MALIAGRRRRPGPPAALIGGTGRASRSARRRTLAIGVFGGAVTVAAFAVEVGRIWRRGSAPLPSEAEDVLGAAEEAVAETVEVAVAGYRQVSTRENAVFNLFASFAITFAVARAITYLLRERKSVGPFRNVLLGRRHIHHFVPGILLAFLAGAVAILTDEEGLEPHLALAFGIGMGLTLDESALLLELDDVYWTEQGLLSVQIAMAVMAMLAALILGLRFLRRGEQVVLEEDVPGAGPPPAAAERGR